jgi:hypothetical protein
MHLGIFFAAAAGICPATTSQFYILQVLAVRYRAVMPISGTSPSQFSHFDPQDSPAEFSEENLPAIGFCGGIVGAKWENCDKTLSGPPLKKP